MKLESGPASPVPETSTPDGEAVAHALAHEPAAEPSALSVASDAGLDRRYVTAALMLVMVLASMEMTVTSTAMPTIIGELHGLEHYSWVASIYLLALTVSMPLYGRLADALGRKQVMLSRDRAVLPASAPRWRHRAHDDAAHPLPRPAGAGGRRDHAGRADDPRRHLHARRSGPAIQGFFSAVWGTGGARRAGAGARCSSTRSAGDRSSSSTCRSACSGLLVLMWKYHDTREAALDRPGSARRRRAGGRRARRCSRWCRALGPAGGRGGRRGRWRSCRPLSIVFFVCHERRAANPVMPPRADGRAGDRPVDGGQLSCSASAS